MQIKNFILFFTLLLTACSQKTPTIDGQKNRFVNKFFPAIIDPLYSKGDVTKEKYPIIFLFDGYEGVWDSGGSMLLDYKVKRFKKADEDNDGELSFLEWIGVYKYAR